jgi:hypothetical protein
VRTARHWPSPRPARFAQLARLATSAPPRTPAVTPATIGLASMVAHADEPPCRRRAHARASLSARGRRRRVALTRSAVAHRPAGAAGSSRSVTLLSHVQKTTPARHRRVPSDPTPRRAGRRTVGGPERCQPGRFIIEPRCANTSRGPADVDTGACVSDPIRDAITCLGDGTRRSTPRRGSARVVPRRARARAQQPPAVVRGVGEQLVTARLRLVPPAGEVVATRVRTRGPGDGRGSSVASAISFVHRSWAELALHLEPVELADDEPAATRSAVVVRIRICESYSYPASSRAARVTGVAEDGVRGLDRSTPGCPTASFSRRC